MLPGLHVLTDKIPELATPRGILRALVSFLGVLLVTLVVLLYVNGRSPFLALLIQLAVYVAIHFLLREFYALGVRLPYAEAFFNRFLPAAGLTWASIGLVLLTPSGSPGAELFPRVVPVWLGVIGVLYLGLTGLALMIGTLRAAGIDTLAGVYIYYPDEGRRVTGGVYDVLAHPAYGAIARLTLGVAMLNGSAFSLLLAAVFVLGHQAHWRELEESELRARFGDAYTTYRQGRASMFPTSLAGELELLRSVLRGGARAAEPEPSA